MTFTRQLSLLTLHKRPPKPEDFDDNMALTWRVRFMLGFVKMKARRQEVSKVARLFCWDLVSTQRFGKTSLGGQAQLELVISKRSSQVTG